MTFPTSWLYLRRTGELPRQLAGFDPGQPTWMVVQNRPGEFQEGQRGLVAQVQPAYTVTKLGIPLIWIYRFDDFYSSTAARPSK